ncbi:HipA N-terminal domain-containing protein, partial [Bacteroides cellulosilyticus]|uniref:HipA N-terminal domain-containing protein n=1 Tax=Bacteroides cellulosilyticus TaxID=246787 RepID=UPI0012316E44
VLTETDDGKCIFRYNDSYLLDKKQTAISLSFPKSQQEFVSDTLFPFFYNMLSEGANKTIQCQTLKIDEDDVFGLLLATAHSDTIGAITVKKI